MTSADGPSVGRLVSFSDAVFAIAITLLALQLRVPAIKYAAALTVITLMSVAVWVYAEHAGLTEPNLDSRFRYYFTIRPLVIAGVFLASIGVAFVSVTAASRLWFVAFPALLVLRFLSRDPED